MVSTSTLCKNLLNVKDIVIKDVNSWTDKRGVQRLLIKARPHKRLQNRCPHCDQKCPGYDHRGAARKWRALDCGGIIVEIESTSQRKRHISIHVVGDVVKQTGFGVNKIIFMRLVKLFLRSVGH